MSFLPDDAELEVVLLIHRVVLRADVQHQARTLAVFAASKHISSLTVPLVHPSSERILNA